MHLRCLKIEKRYIHPNENWKRRVWKKRNRMKWAKSKMKEIKEWNSKVGSWKIQVSYLFNSLFGNLLFPLCSIFCSWASFFFASLSVKALYGNFSWELSQMHGHSSRLRIYIKFSLVYCISTQSHLNHIVLSI